MDALNAPNQIQASDEAVRLLPNEEAQACHVVWIGKSVVQMYRLRNEVC